MRGYREAGSYSILLLIAVAVGVASFAILRNDPWAVSGNRLSDRFRLDTAGLTHVDPDLLVFESAAEFPLSAMKARAIACGPNERIYVAAGPAVHILSTDGRQLSTIPTSTEPRCLAVGGDQHQWPGRIYVAGSGSIQTFTPDGNLIATWDRWGGSSLLTSIALTAQEVFVADAGQRVVWRLNTDGQLISRINGPDEGDASSFIVPGPHFDVAAGDELMHIANPGAQRIESYSHDGRLQAVWGKAGSSVSDFFGCCNPTHLAVLPDGAFVTAEKGIPRIKIYSPDGRFEGVVAGPEQLGISEAEIGDPRLDENSNTFDVAIDGRGRVLVLDPRRNTVRIFIRRTPS